MRLEPTLQIASMFVRPGGVAFLWKGSRLQSELSAHAESPGGWVFVEEMPLSVTGASVCKLVFVK